MPFGTTLATLLVSYLSPRFGTLAFPVQSKVWSKEPPFGCGLEPASLPCEIFAKISSDKNFGTPNPFDCYQLRAALQMDACEPGNSINHRRFSPKLSSAVQRTRLHLFRRPDETLRHNS